MRNEHGLDPRQIDAAQAAWEFMLQPEEGEQDNSVEPSKLSGLVVRLDTSQAHEHSSTTVFLEGKGVVRLGANAYPSSNGNVSANGRMSLLACLCHEYSHAQRYHLGFRRPLEGSGMLLDEAETSIHASHMPFLNHRDRQDLVDDAAERLVSWKKEFAK
jgi:hypothetical protein